MAEVAACIICEDLPCPHTTHPLPLHPPAYLHGLHLTLQALRASQYHALLLAPYKLV